MRIRDPQGEEEPYNLVPLTDMVFNLLIFFMAATTFAQIEKDLSLQLPAAGRIRGLSGAPQQLIINVKDDGAMVVSGRTYADDELRGLLSNTAKTEPGRVVLIRADERGIHRYFAGVLRLCNESGINEVKVGYLGGGAQP
jgi:biopolymer transport protein ExbD